MSHLLLFYQPIHHNEVTSESTENIDINWSYVALTKH